MLQGLAPPKVVAGQQPQRPAGPVTGEVLPDPVAQPREFLRAVFEMVVATDKEGYFLRPVDESQAPGYYQQIKNPLCFADMRSKLERGVYTSYRSMLADYELIINNAKTFNKEKTKCYKCAMALSRNVSKIMSSHEIGTRKAFSVLYPRVPGLAAPGASGAAGSRGTPNPQDASDITSAGPSTGAAATPGQQQPDAPAPAAEQPQDAPAAAAPTSALPSSAPAGNKAGPTLGPPLPNGPLLLLPPVRIDPLCKAYSDDEEDDVQAVLQHHRQLRGDQNRRLKRKPVALEALMAELRHAAVFQPWSDLLPTQGPPAQAGASAQGPAPDEARPSTAQQSEQPAQPGASQPATQQGPPAVAAAQGPPLAPGSREAQVHQARQSLEWQRTWLELRMAELEAQIARLSQLEAAGSTADTAGQSSSQKAQAGGSGSSAVVAQDATRRRQELQRAIDRHRHGSSAVAGQPSQLQPAPHVRHKPLQSAPFFAGLTPAAQGAVAGTATQPAQRADAAAGSAAAAGAQPMDVDPPAAQPAAQPAAGKAGRASTQLDLLLPQVMDSVSNAQLPAAVFSALEVLEAQIMDVRRGIQSAFALDKGRRPGVARNGAFQHLPSGAASAVAGSSGLMRKPSMAPRPSPVQRSGSSLLAAPHKSGGDPASKRKRVDGDQPDTPSLHTARTMDRPMQAIVIPPIRTLPDDEVSAREDAIGAWVQAAQDQGAAAWSQPPSEVLDVCGDEGSSDEDTGDEAYARMHAIMAEEERKRFAAAADGQRRRNKQSSKNTGKGKNNPPAASGAGQAGPSGHKRPANIKTQRTGSSALAAAAAGAAAQGAGQQADGAQSDGPARSAGAHALQRTASGHSVPLVQADTALPTMPAVAPHPLHRTSSLAAGQGSPLARATPSPPPPLTTAPAQAQAPSPLSAPPKQPVSPKADAAHPPSSSKPAAGSSQEPDEAGMPAASPHAQPAAAAQPPLSNGSLPHAHAHVNSSAHMSGPNPHVVAAAALMPASPAARHLMALQAHAAEVAQKQQQGGADAPQHSQRPPQPAGVSAAAAAAAAVRRSSRRNAAAGAHGQATPSPQISIDHESTPPVSSAAAPAPAAATRSRRATATAANAASAPTSDADYESADSSSSDAASGEEGLSRQHGSASGADTDDEGDDPPSDSGDLDVASSDLDHDTDASDSEGSGEDSEGAEDEEGEEDEGAGDEEDGGRQSRSRRSGRSGPPRKRSRRAGGAEAGRANGATNGRRLRSREPRSRKQQKVELRVTRSQDVGKKRRSRSANAVGAGGSSVPLPSKTSSRIQSSASLAASKRR